MSIESLRAKALAYAPTFRYPVCLDPEMRTQLDEASSRLLKLQGDLREMAALPPDERRAKRMSEQPPSVALAAEVAEAEAEVQRIENLAAGDVLVVVFRRLPPDDYQALVDGHTQGSTVSLPDLHQSIVRESYLRSESGDGEDVGLDYAQIWNGVLNHGDRDVVLVGVLELNRGVSAVPFSQRSSGQPGTSSKPA